MGLEGIIKRMLHNLILGHISNYFFHWRNLYISTHSGMGGTALSCSQEVLVSLYQ
jgi:hypothetical protein